MSARHHHLDRKARVREPSGRSPLNTAHAGRRHLIVPHVPGMSSAPIAMPVDAQQPIVAEPRGRYARLPPLVVDCSVLAAVLFDEADREAAAMTMAGKELFAPALIDHEMISVALKKADADLDDVVKQALTDLAQIQLTRCFTDIAAQWALAREHGLTAYDAAYLQLAIELGAPLATFDRKLGEVAQRVLGGGNPGN